MTQKMTRLSILLCSALVLAGLAFSTPATAQDSAPNVRALVVDLQEVQRTSLAGKDLLQQMETYRAELESEMSNFEQQVERERSDLQNKRSQVEQGVRTEDAFQENVRASQARMQEERAKIDDKRRRLQIAASRADQELRRALRPIYQDLMKKYGANLLLERSQVLMVGSGMDITRDVVERLDQVLPSLKLELPPPGEGQQGG